MCVSKSLQLLLRRPSSILRESHRVQTAQVMTTAWQFLCEKCSLKRVSGFERGTRAGPRLRHEPGKTKLLRAAWSVKPEQASLTHDWPDMREEGIRQTRVRVRLRK